MNTSVILSSSQQKKALSAKKKSKKVTIKNVLATPYSNYWPLLNDEDASSLKQLLSEQLTRIKPPKVSVPWKELKDVPRENRKVARRNYANVQLEVEQKYTKSEIAMGINEVTKMVERGTANSVLISDDVNPHLMVKHILDMAVLGNIPVVVVSSLKSLLKERTGITSAVVAFVVKSDDSKYWTIDQKIRELHANYPAPLNHINYHRQNSAPADDSEYLKETDVADDKMEEKQLRDLHLHRKSKLKRVFIPKLSCERKSVFNTTIESGEFLALDNPSDKSSINHVQLKIKTKVSYKSLIVKRIKNNQHREKKKIDRLKGTL